MSDKVIALHPQSEQQYTCKECQELHFRVQRSLNLHAQTTCQLAQVEGQLVEAKRRIRELEARLTAKETPRCN